MEIESEIENAKQSFLSKAPNVAQLLTVLGLMVAIFTAVVVPGVGYSHNVDNKIIALEALSETRRIENIERDRKIALLEVKTANQDILLTRIDTKLNLMMGSMKIKFTVDRNGEAQPYDNSSNSETIYQSGGQQ